MELPKPPGAGPESTGIKEQLILFEWPDTSTGGPLEASSDEESTMQSPRPCAQPGPTEHVIARGERLGGLCLRPRSWRLP